jgi:hypothetical protein
MQMRDLAVGQSAQRMTLQMAELSARIDCLHVLLLARSQRKKTLQLSFAPLLPENMHCTHFFSFIYKTGVSPQHMLLCWCGFRSRIRLVDFVVTREERIRLSYGGGALI